MTDTELLRQYAQEGSQEAFTQLVRQHVDVVYSAARRQARGDAHLAEEITQQVFILLAQKAKTISGDVLLGGWLYNAVRFIARDVVRKEERRSHHEQKAAAMADQLRNAAANGGKQDAPSGTWDDAEEILDDVLGTLDAGTRGLIVLRYFEGKTAGEVATRLGISEDAARKRVNRAVEQLRDLFARRGVVMSASALAESLAAKTIMHAPAHLAASAASAAMSSSVAAATSAGAVKIGAVLMAAKGNLIAASIIGAVCLAGAVVGGVKAVQHFSSVQPTSPGATKTIRVVPIGPAMSGFVRDAAGKPVADAELLIASQGKSVNIYAPPAGGMVNSTAADGAFAFNKPADHYELIIRSPQGFAQVSGETLAKSTDIRIAPWGRVEGRVMAGITPQANVAIYTFETPAPYGYSTVMRQTQTRTDSDGRFVFPQIAPGEIRLAQQDPVTQRFYRWTYSVVDAGKTTMISIGGMGRPIIGRFASPSATQPLVWDYKSKKFNPNASLRRTDGLSFRRPEHQANETLEEWRAIEEAFGRTPEGAAINGSATGGWQFRVNADGTFRIDDVPAGQYALEAGVMQLDVNSAEVIAQAATSVVTEPMPGDRSDEPLDIGSVPMKSIAHLHAGDRITPFDVTMLDGSIKNVTDFADKHLLVVFIAPQKDYKDGVDAFKQLAADYADNPRLQVLWLNISTPEEAAAGASAYGLLGPVASVALPDIPSEYDAILVCGVLIDPSGKLVQKRMTPELAKQQLQKTLGAAKARK